MTRVLVVTQYYPPEMGAAAVRVHAMCSELVSRGFDVDVVTALPNYPLGRIYDDYRGKVWHRESVDGVSVYRSWIYPAVGSGRGRMLNLATFVAHSIVSIFRPPRPDLMLVESPPLPVAFVGTVHRLVRRTPQVALLADLWPDTGVDLGLLRPGSRMLRVMSWLERRFYRQSTWLSPVTDGQVRTLVDDKGIDPAKLAFLPNGVDTDLFHPAETAPSNRDIVFAGNLGLAQGLDVILDAAPRVRARHPEARFVLIGSGSDRERIAGRLRDEHIEGVELRDPVDLATVATIMRESFAGITSLKKSPVFDGARPSKMFTIMASGRPVVYSGDGEGARLVADAGAGVVAPAEDAEALAEAIIGLLDDPARATEHGRTGREYVERELSWPSLIERWLQTIGVPTNAQP